MADTKEFLKGQLLLDSGQLRGSFFQRTVVLICQAWPEVVSILSQVAKKWLVTRRCCRLQKELSQTELSETEIFGS